MAKKKATKKLVPKKSVTAKSSSAAKKSVAKKSVAKSSSSKSSSSKSSAKKYKKKVGRKPSTPNRYNTIKSAISSYYQSTINRSVKRYEMKVIYNWIKENYGNQSVKYVVMNIDVIIDNFWKEYCNIYPVDLENHARYFDWYYLKDYLTEESEYHYPSDIIQIDLSSIGEGTFEFFMEDYVRKADEYYAICTAAGIRRYNYPMIYLKDAFCDIAKKGNVYHYVLYLDDDVPNSTSKRDLVAETTITPTTDVIASEVSSTAVDSTAVDSTASSAASSAAVDSAAVDSAAAASEPKTNEDAQKQIELSIQKEKELIQQRQLIKDKLNAIKELKNLGFSLEEIKNILKDKE